MRTLFDRFYRAILEDGTPPIAYGEICRATEIMDRIFAACRQSPSEADAAESTHSLVH